MKHARILAAFTLALAAYVAHATACDFAPVKKEIDNILDHDKERAARFRRDVAAGYDSLKIVTDLTAPDMREKIDICRFFAAEYLAKRGFPPAH